METPPIFRFTTAQLPGNSQYARLYDSTSPPDAWLATAALSAPGDRCGKLRGLRITGAVTPTGQDVTVQFYARVGFAGTNADWVLDTTVSGTSSSGFIAVTAGSTQMISWAPDSVDCMVVVLAGATAPTSVAAELQLGPPARVW